MLGSGDKGLRLLGGFVLLMGLVGEGRVAGGLVGRLGEVRRREGYGGVMKDWKA